MQNLKLLAKILLFAAAAVGAIYLMYLYDTRGGDSGTGSGDSAGITPAITPPISPIMMQATRPADPIIPGLPANIANAIINPIIPAQVATPAIIPIPRVTPLEMTGVLLAVVGPIFDSVKASPAMAVMPVTMDPPPIPAIPAMPLTMDPPPIPPIPAIPGVPCRPYEGNLSLDFFKHYMVFNRGEEGSMIGLWERGCQFMVQLFPPQLLAKNNQEFVADNAALDIFFATLDRDLGPLSERDRSIMIVLKSVAKVYNHALVKELNLNDPVVFNNFKKVVTYLHGKCGPFHHVPDIVVRETILH